MNFFKKTAENAEQQKQDEIMALLVDGERLLKIYNAFVDYCALTDKRVIMVDKELTSAKTVITSIPYSKINTLSIGKSGGFMAFNKVVQISAGTRNYEIILILPEHAQELHKAISNRIL